MLKEVSDQKGNGNLLIISKSEVPKDAKVLPAVWQMKRNLDIMSRKVKKWKAKYSASALCLQKRESPNLEGNPLLAFKANADPDTMYMHEAFKDPDRAQFVKAMLKEVSDQMGNGNFSIISK